MTTQLKIVIDVEGELIYSTLGEFLHDNEFDPEEEREIATALNNGEMYTGGGGAGVMFSIRRA